MADLSTSFMHLEKGDTYLLRYNVVRQFLMQPEHDGKANHFVFGEVLRGGSWAWNLEDFLCSHSNP